MIEELEQTDNLKNELSHLKSLLNACNEQEFKNEYSRIAIEYTQEAHKQQIFEFIKNGFQDINKE